MTTTKSLSVIFIAYIISICICQPPDNGGGSDNGPDDRGVYVGRIDLLPDQFDQPRNFAQVTIDYINNRVEIVYQGDDNFWNGIGFGGQVMENTYAIIMDYSNGQPVVFETILGDHNAGEQQELTNLNVEADLFNGTLRRRTIIVSRPIQAEGDPGYSFPDRPSSEESISIPIIAAQGPGYDFFIPPTNRHSFFDREPSYYSFFMLLTFSLLRIG